MKTGRTLGLLGTAAVVVTLTACPGERQETAEPAADVPVVEVGPGMQREEVQALPPPERVAVQEVGASGVAVEAVLSPLVGSTHAVLEVRRAPANASLQGALHQGQCGMPGEQVASLGSVTTDAAGTGRGEAHLDIPAHLIFDGQHHVQVQGAGQAQMAACGDIPARAIPRLEAAPPPAAGEQYPGQPPGTPQPGAQQPGMQQPATQQPGAQQPGTQRP
jgi:hypothetical protein